MSRDMTKDEVRAAEVERFAIIIAVSDGGMWDKIPEPERDEYRVNGRAIADALAVVS